MYSVLKLFICACVILEMQEQGDLPAKIQDFSEDQWDKIYDRVEVVDSGFDAIVASVICEKFPVIYYPMNKTIQPHKFMPVLKQLLEAVKWKS